MKTQIVLLALLIVVTVFPFCKVEAQSSYTTQKNFVFTNVVDSKFGTAWKAPDGNIWSQYQGQYSNLGKAAGESIVDSPATKKCLEIGGELPSLEQFRILANYFANTADYRAIFPSQNTFFWTSSAPTATQGAFVRFVKLAPFLDPFGDVAQSSRLLGVQCVHAPL